MNTILKHLKVQVFIYLVYHTSWKLIVCMYLVIIIYVLWIWIPYERHVTNAKKFCNNFIKNYSFYYIVHVINFHLNVAVGESLKSQQRFWAREHMTAKSKENILQCKIKIKREKKPFVFLNFFPEFSANPKNYQFDLCLISNLQNIV